MRVGCRQWLLQIPYGSSVQDVLNTNTNSVMDFQDVIRLVSGVHVIVMIGMNSNDVNSTKRQHRFCCKVS